MKSQAKIRYEKIADQTYSVYLGTEEIGIVRKMDNRMWRATRQGSGIYCHSRGEGVEWLMRKMRE